MNKKNPTIGELQVFSGILMWIAGSLFVLYELIKSIVENNFINRWKFILVFAGFVAAFGALLYFVGKYRIEQGKKEEKENNK
ncbi:MAG: hypothetical protein IJ966_06545 [Bacilli bacterium]|nr:hypothetical protein [Bacilli bacterium]